MSKRVYNFSAGPAVLPEAVLRKAADEMLNYNGSGMSVMELSHRSKLYLDIITGAENMLRKLMGIPENYKILFLQGGASTQFLMVPLNLMKKNKKADYVNTGTWSKKAIAEAQKLGDIKIVADSSDKNFSYYPDIDSAQIRNDSSYFHVTSNNTIYGTRLAKLPETTIPIVCDMSSNILSEVIEVNKYVLIYAGAQKNIGPAGVTIVIIREDFIGKVEDLPTMLNYKTHANSGSMFNTPPTFGIYIAKLVFEYLLALGGIAAVEKINRQKAEILYEAIDNSTLFKTHVPDKKHRSLMNIPFFTESEKLNSKFIQQAAEKGFVTLNGHRSIGGMRASIYNAMPVKGIEKLAEFIKIFDFENK